MKNKRTKDNTSKGSSKTNEDYPDTQNPFSEDYRNPEPVKNGKSARERTTSDAKGLKGKKSKIKKAKKAKKLQGKRERAVSRAVATQIEKEGDSMRTRAPTIVISEELEVMNTDKKAKAKADKKAKKIEKKEIKREKKVRKKEKKAIKKQNHNDINKPQSADIETKQSLPTYEAQIKPQPSNEPPVQSFPAVTPERIRQLQMEDNFSSLPSAAKRKAKANKSSAHEKTKRHSAGDITELHQHSSSTPSASRAGLILNVTEKTKSSNEMLSPIAESPVDAVVPEPVTRNRRRTGSVLVSSKERRKKKRLRLRKKWKRLKHKNAADDDEGANLHYGENDYNPIAKPPANNGQRVEELRNRVEEVKNIVSSSVATDLEKRHTLLTELNTKAELLETSSHTFAKVATETRLKKQSQARCCGMFSKYRVCWYICACQSSRVKKAPIKKRTTENREAEAKFLTRGEIEDEDDFDDGPFALVDEAKVMKRSNLSLAPSSTKRSSTSSILPMLKNSKAYLSVSRTSLPIVGNLRSLGRMRKASSSGKLEDEARSRLATRTKEEIEEDVRSFAAKYEDDETRNRVTELLMLDHTNK